MDSDIIAPKSYSIWVTSKTASLWAKESKSHQINCLLALFCLKIKGRDIKLTIRTRRQLFLPLKLSHKSMNLKEQIQLVLLLLIKLADRMRDIDNFHYLEYNWINLGLLIITRFRDFKKTWDSQPFLENFSSSAPSASKPTSSFKIKKRETNSIKTLKQQSLLAHAWSPSNHTLRSISESQLLACFSALLF